MTPPEKTKAGMRRFRAASPIWGNSQITARDQTRFFLHIDTLLPRRHRAYGLNLDVRFTPGPSMPSMAARTAQEFQAGRTASTDLLAGYANHIRAVTQVGGIEAVDWRAWAPNLQDPRLISANGMAVATAPALSEPLFQPVSAIQAIEITSPALRTNRIDHIDVNTRINRRKWLVWSRMLAAT